MCTLTLTTLDGRGTLVMNRDDRIDRPEAGPDAGGDTGFVGPRDLRSGGTWIGVNRAGLAACLLNRYDRSAPNDKFSRGLIVPEVLRATEPDAALARVDALDLDRFPPFTLVVASRHGVRRLDWTGRHRLTDVEPDAIAPDGSWMTTSSSVRAEEVRARRRTLFFDLFARPDRAAALATFHTTADEGDGWWSPWMTRDVAHTKSITCVTWRRDAATLDHRPRTVIERDGLFSAPR